MVNVNSYFENRKLAHTFPVDNFEIFDSLTYRWARRRQNVKQLLSGMTCFTKISLIKF